jgi:rhodanese-related sulfurtransferase
MKTSHLNVKDAHELMQSRPDITIVDIRTAEEFEMSYVEGALNIDFQSEVFKFKLSELDNNTEYLIHCHSGERSLAALEIFKELKFKHIYHMDGGMRAWAQAELPTVYNWFI